MPISELAKLIHRWPPAVINHMTWQQREIELMSKVAKTEFRQKHLMPCTFCGAIIKTDMYRHVARRHLQLAQPWRCPVSWCTVWRGAPQDLMDHILDGHNVPREIKRASLQKLFPPWTVTREQYAESLSAQRNDVLLFSEVGLSLVHHYRVHNVGRPHAMFRRKYLAQLRALLPTGTTTPTVGKPSITAGPRWHPQQAGQISCVPHFSLRDVVSDHKDIFRIRRSRSRLSSRSRTSGWRQELWCLIVVRHCCRCLWMFRACIPPAEPVVVPSQLEQRFRGVALFDYIGLELDVTPLLDSGPDCQDELSSPDGSPMVISPIVPLLPEQVEEDVDLAHILAEFGTLPAIVTPIDDPHEERKLPPRNIYRRKFQLMCL